MRIVLIRASGANHFPFRMPIEASRPRVSAPVASTGSSCTTSVLLETFTNFGSGGALTVGSFDGPQAVTSDHHYGIEGRIAWVDIGASSPGEATQERW
jgi:hypothetical protein